MGKSFKSEIAPKGLNFNINDFVISDKYATILTIISFPKVMRYQNEHEITVQERIRQDYESL